IRVYFRVCQPDQGLFADITEAQIDTDFDHLVGAYTADNICFVNCGHDYIQSSALDTFNTNNNSSTIFYPYGIQNCITVFYISHLGGTNGSNGGGFSGITYGIPSAWSIVEKDFIGQGVLEHEVGHCLGLLHTFDYVHGYGLEDINGANGATAADKVADTPADPYAFASEDASTCFSVSNDGCTYTGTTCSDPNGQTNYSPPYTNIMSYWCQGFYPTGTFTSGQYTRINSFLSTAAVLTITESANTVTVGPNVTKTSGYLMNSAITTLTTSGTVSLSATSISTFGGQTVLLEPGFHSAPSSGGYFLARTETCVPEFPRLIISNSDVNNGTTVNQNLQSSFIAYPNPTSSLLNVKFNLKENETQALLRIYDTNLKLMEEINFDDLHSGTQTQQINLQSLPSGVYYLILKSSSSKMTTKVVLEK
ncbi:MAG: zinc-dependent metalloprotease, partial [Chitinophagales bacterium]